MEATLSNARPSTLGAIGQVVLILVLMLVGLIAGALTGIVVMSSILGMALPLLVATWFLRRERSGWHDLGFGISMPFMRFLAYTLVAVASIFLLAEGLLRWGLEAAGLPPIDLSSLKDLVHDDLTYYLLFLIPVSWGSAAFGEELLVRGFILNRLEILTNNSMWAVVSQAAIFALAHFYQGITGVLVVFMIGLIMGAVFIRCGRNLWPVIVAHGLADTIAVTSFYFGWNLL